MGQEEFTAEDEEASDVGRGGRVSTFDDLLPVHLLGLSCVFHKERTGGEE